jgi:hypothetical protein
MGQIQQEGCQKTVNYKDEIDVDEIKSQLQSTMEEKSRWFFLDDSVLRKWIIQITKLLRENWKKRCNS